MTIIIIIIISILIIIFLRGLFYLFKSKHNDIQEVNEKNINNKTVIYNCKRILNGEESDGQLFFINKNDVTDIKLAYELISAQKAVDYGFITHDNFVIDSEDKYIEYIITDHKEISALDIYDNLNEDDFNYLSKYSELLQKRSHIDKKLKEFMLNSNIDDEQSLIMYYKSIIESKKINDEETTHITMTYFKMIDQIERLNLLNQNEAINNEISKTNITYGFDQSKLKEEFDQLLKK